jgi:hypothetical protein
MSLPSPFSAPPLLSCYPYSLPLSAWSDEPPPWFRSGQEVADTRGPSAPVQKLPDALAIDLDSAGLSQVPIEPLRARLRHRRLRIISVVAVCPSAVAVGGAPPRSRPCRWSGPRPRVHVSVRSGHAPLRRPPSFLRPCSGKLRGPVIVFS